MVDNLKINETSYDKDDSLQDSYRKEPDEI